MWVCMCAMSTSSPHPDPHILFDCAWGISVDQFDVLVPEEGVFPARCELADATVELEWAKQLEERPGTYNASKFRLVDAHVSEDGRVRLTIGLTDYRATLCCHTRRPDVAEELAAMGVARRGQRSAFLPCGMGCETALVTRDGMVPMILRSGSVATHSGMLQVAGSGHLEPSDAGVESEAALRSKTSGELARAIFAGALAEVVEETGLREVEVREMRLLGCVSCNHKPGLMFVARTALSMEEVLLAHAEARGRGEAASFFGRGLGELCGGGSAGEDEEGRRNTTPMTRGMLQLLRRHVALGGGGGGCLKPVVTEAFAAAGGGTRAAPHA